MLVNSEVTIKGDFHCHTLASLHAYSTLRENLIAAQKRGLRLLAITDHGIGTPDSPPLSFFENLTSLPQNVDGIRLLRGVEANIMDHTGDWISRTRFCGSLTLWLHPIIPPALSPGQRRSIHGLIFSLPRTKMWI